MIYKEEKIKDKNRFFRRIENYKYDTSRKFNHGLNNLWKGIGNAGINFLNILPKLGFYSLNFLEMFLQMYLTQFIINKLIKKVQEK